MFKVIKSKLKVKAALVILDKTNVLLPKLLIHISYDSIHLEESVMALILFQFWTEK